MDICCSGDYTFVSTKDGLYTFGDNYYGQLGHANRIVIFLKKLDIIDIVTMPCGTNHSLVLTKDGLYGTGSNDYGQLGLNNYATYCTFQKINILMFYQ